MCYACFMKQGSTFLLKSVIYLIALAVLGVCVILLGNMFGGDGAGMFLPVMLVMFIAKIQMSRRSRKGKLFLIAAQCLSMTPEWSFL